MDHERSTLLAKLLREMREEDGDYFPEEAWLEIHKTFALPYVELIIPHRTDEQWQLLLTRRAPTDVDWPSTWHVPGGLWRTKLTQPEACQSVAKRELGIELADIHEVMTFKWPSHPRGYVISHVCVCWPSGPVSETTDRKFFFEIPKPFIEEEIAFIERSLKYLKKGTNRD